MIILESGKSIAMPKINTNKVEDLFDVVILPTDDYDILVTFDIDTGVINTISMAEWVCDPDDGDIIEYTDINTETAEERAQIIEVANTHLQQYGISIRF